MCRTQDYIESISLTHRYIRSMPPQQPHRLYTSPPWNFYSSGKWQGIRGVDFRKDSEDYIFYPCSFRTIRVPSARAFKRCLGNSFRVESRVLTFLIDILSAPLCLWLGRQDHDEHPETAARPHCALSGCDIPRSNARMEKPGLSTTDAQVHGLVNLVQHLSMPLSLHFMIPPPPATIATKLE